MLRLGKHLLPLLREASPLPSLLRRGLLLSTSPSPSPAPFSLEAYLVASCGLAPAQARRASKKAFDDLSKLSGKPFEEISHSRLHSASNPDAVLAVLSDVGLSRADIAAAVMADPLILRCGAKNIRPRLLALRDHVGLSVPQIARFLSVGAPAVRRCGDIAPKLKFFISFFGSFEQVLEVMKSNMKSNYRILSSNLETVLKPNIALFRQCGLSVRDIAHLCSRNKRVIMFKPERVKEFIKRAEKLGVPRSSRMFVSAVKVSANISKEKVAAKLEFLKRIFGCSEAEVAIAVSKRPNILEISEDNILRKIQFLINEVGMEPRYIVERPQLLALSLERRLAPRHRVMKALQTKGLLNSKTMSFYSICILGEGTFRLKFIDRHKDSVTGLADAYAAACAGVPAGVQL
ncbi:hypothetical protein ACP70R_041572 [Stipagrostis hirtigluma subsp. patula]